MEKIETAPQIQTSDVLSYIGNTPIIKIKKIGSHLVKRNVEIYAKAEWFNPGGSVKARPALRMVEEAEENERLTKNKVILDSTSGNTGIAYAMIGAVKGYRVELVMPENVSLERKRLIAAYGAKVVFTDPMMGSDGAILEARRRFSLSPERYFMPDQYNNPANVRAHYDTTGVEIWKQTSKKVTHFVAGIGTGGTVTGTGKRLKEYNPDICVYAIEPSSPLHGLEGLKHMGSSLVPGIYDESFLDGKISMETEDAYDMVARLAREEGLVVGHSSGAALKGALHLAETLSDAVIVTIFPDAGEHYLSTHFWVQTFMEDK